MYHYQTAYWPQSNPYFAAFKKVAGHSGNSPVWDDSIANRSSPARTDRQIEQDVRDELEMEPSVRAAAIGVQVKDGVVALTGVVDGEGERWLIESAARRIVGVRSLLTQLKAFAPEVTPADDDIAHDCERVLGALTPKSDYAIGVMVSHGWVTLSGNVAEGYERRTAETEVASLLSVHGVNSQVRVRSSKARSDADASVVDSTPEQRELKSGGDDSADGKDRVTRSRTVLSWTQYRNMLYAAWSSSRTKRVISLIRAS